MRLRRPAVIVSVGMAVLAAGCTDPEEPKRPGIELDRTTAEGGAAPEEDRGLPAAPLREQWRADVTGLPAPAGARVEMVAGRVVVLSDRGLDVLDAGTGRPSWHYRERSRAVTDYTVTPDTVVVTTSATSGTRLRLDGARRLRSTALDAATGRTLWTDDRALWAADDLAGLAQRPGERREYPAAKAGTVVLKSGDENRPGLAGVDARTGKQRWTWAPQAAAGRCSFRPYDTDGSLLVVASDCDKTAYALDPASGRVRWQKVPGKGTSHVLTRDGVTLLTASAPGGDNVSTLVGADGREIWKLTSRTLSADELAVAGDHAVVTVADNDRGYGLRMEFVNLHTRKVDGRTDARAHDGLVAAGGRVYGVRQWIGEYQGFGYGLPPRLVPGALDVADPARRTVTTVPLPFAMDDDPLKAMPRPVLIKGERVLRVRPSGTALNLVAYGPDGSAKRARPVETGGVAPSDWPDACALTAKARDVRARDEVPKRPLRLGRVEIEHWGCRVTGPPSPLRLHIGWVARTPAEAHALLDGMSGGPVDGFGDEARAVKGLLGTWTYMRTGRYLVVLESSDTREGGFAQSVAKAVDGALR
ncbi:PQQ-binding-like beta-propeller repeat protein [Actinomadura verrucosospora]|uniref:Pyrrolo-quinoline quinone repeat domain-containing protein n=1 Tax=Actinomadura verrucosospora TaxID=46165 RepID=A0A7D3ZNL6_ACTVE|nr:PQQ-binding-like beta-propeller repeat protein [Actinomadura verrucosospora]QKG24961.1 hypothetical protein ACTIVE_6612 [Actinomadura verrucosospora]